jgi:hypothetical protein
MLAIPAAVLLAVLAGCGSGSDEPQPGKSTPELIASILQATPNPVTPDQVAEAFALGSDSTDLQRDLIKESLVGSVVEWDIQVYEVSYADGRYKVTSQPIPITSTDAVQLLRVVAFVSAPQAADEEVLRVVKSNEVLRIRGLVQDIVLRTVVTIGPAIIVGDRESVSE